MRAALSPLLERVMVNDLVGISVVIWELHLKSIRAKAHHRLTLFFLLIDHLLLFN